MRRTLVPLAIGCVLVGVVATVLVIVGWQWSWFALANGALAVLMLVLFRGSVTGEDPDRPPGVARVSAARAAGPFDPDTLGAEESALYPDAGRCGRRPRRGRRYRLRLLVDRRRAGGRGGPGRRLLSLAERALPSMRSGRRVNAFAVVVALAAVAALGWALTAVARRILRRYGVETDERSEDDEGRT